MTRYVMSRTEKIARRLDRGGRLTAPERRELFATGRMLDSTAAQIQMLYEDDVFAAVDLAGSQKDLREIFEDLRDIARQVMARAEE